MSRTSLLRITGVSQKSTSPYLASRKVSDGKLKFPSKIRRIPAIWNQFKLTRATYHRLKGEYLVLGLCGFVTEVFVRFWCSMKTMVICSPPLSCVTGRVIRVVDDFACHQLDFVAKKFKLVKL